MIDALPLGEIDGQHAPLDPAFSHIKDGIEHGPHTQSAWASTVFSGGDQIFDPLPFLVGQVAWIGFFIHISILHNPRRLFRQALRACVRHGPRVMCACLRCAPHTYWITSSARRSRDGGIVIPSALAVLRLITSSNFIGCSTGKSAGLAPLRILSTYVAARRNRSGWLAP